MQSKGLQNGYIIKLEKGEKIIETLTKFCEANNIKSGSISGVGGTDNVTLGYYDAKTKGYVFKDFNGKDLEIISLNGNVSLVDGKPFLHIHIMLGNEDYSTFGGHLKDATISITGEVVITMTDGEIKREFDEEFKLKFLELT